MIGRVQAGVITRSDSSEKRARRRLLFLAPEALFRDAETILVNWAAVRLSRLTGVSIWIIIQGKRLVSIIFKLVRFPRSGVLSFA